MAPRGELLLVCLGMVTALAFFSLLRATQAGSSLSAVPQWRRQHAHRAGSSSPAAPREIRQTVPANEQQGMVGTRAAGANGGGTSPASPGDTSAPVVPGLADWRRLLARAHEARCGRSLGGPNTSLACAPSMGEETAPRLSQDLVESVMDDHRTVFVAFANKDFTDFAASWLANLAREGVHAVLVGAMDQDALRALEAMRAPCFLMSTPEAFANNPNLRAAEGQGNTEYLKLGSFKTALVAQILGYGVDVVLSDLDNLILRDPRPVFARYPEADVLSTADLLSPTSTSGGLERNVPLGTTLNVGMLLLRASSRPLVREWADHMVEHPLHWDQAVFNDLARRGTFRARPPRRDGQLFACYGGRLWCGVLPVSTFCGGHQFHADALPTKLGRRAYTLHTTYINSLTEGKRHRLREAMAFEDPPEYYDLTPGVLVFDVDVPGRLTSPHPFSITRSPPERQFSVADHFALVHFQLRQIRNAFALANASGRVLVLPRLVCGLDRFFYRHDGISPGSTMTLPIWNCPADMVLALHHGVKPAPERWLRENTFLENPRLPAHMRTEAEVAIEGADAKSRDAVLRILSAPAARAARTLRLVTPPPEAQGWMHADQYEAFEREVRSWGDFWCCAPVEPELSPDMLARVRRHRELGLKAKTHIFYDMFWDKVPHTDRFGRTWTTPWRPIPGERWNLTDAMTDPWRSMVVLGIDPRDGSRVPG